MPPMQCWLGHVPKIGWMQRVISVNMPRLGMHKMMMQRVCQRIVAAYIKATPQATLLSKAGGSQPGAAQVHELRSSHTPSSIVH